MKGRGREEGTRTNRDKDSSVSVREAPNGGWRAELEHMKGACSKVRRSSTGERALGYDEGVMDTHNLKGGRR